MKLMKNSLARHVEQIESLNKSLLEKEELSRTIEPSTSHNISQVDKLKYEEQIASLKQMMQGK